MAAGGYASSRNTQIASLLETFIDNNRDDLSPNLFDALDELAGEIDDAVEEKDKEIEELQERVEEIEAELEGR